jgi:hypothetical protein
MMAPLVVVVFLMGSSSSPFHKQCLGNGNGAQSTAISKPSAGKLASKTIHGIVLVVQAVPLAEVKAVGSTSGHIGVATDALCRKASGSGEAIVAVVISKRREQD